MAQPQAPAPAPVFGSLPLQGPPDGGSLLLALQCRNAPAGGYVTAWVPGPSATATSTLSTSVYDPNIGVWKPVTWPEDYRTYGTLAYWPGAAAAQAGASVQLALWQVVEGPSSADDSEAALVRELTLPPAADGGGETGAGDDPGTGSGGGKIYARMLTSLTLQIA